MKKKFISAMAISMCLCMGAMVGCGGGNNSSSSSSPKEPLTKDEILAQWATRTRQRKRIKTVIP